MRKASERGREEVGRALRGLPVALRDEQSLRGCTLQMLSETPDALELLHTMRQLSESGELVQPVAIKQPKASGEARFVHLHSSPFVSRVGEMLTLVLVQDVTARVQTQLRLDAQEERWRAVFAHSLDLTLAYSQDTTLSFVSPSALRADDETVAPNAPNRTFVSDRFIARHMI